MPDPDITLHIDGSKGRYVTVVNGVEADLTFSIASPALRIADHTGVPDALRGTGTGLPLVERLVADARQHGFKILPLCPFVNAMRCQAS